MRATGLTGYVYDFSVDYWAIANDKILDIHKYLMKKNNIIYNMFGFFEKAFAVIMTSCNISHINSLEFVSMNNK